MTSPASRTSAETSSGSCRTPSTRTEPGFGPDTPDAMSSGTDGLRFFTSAIAAVVGAAA